MELAELPFELPDPMSSEELRARARNAVALMDLENCDIGYSPTRWQRSLFPGIFQDKIRTIFDGIDIGIWRPLTGVPDHRVGRKRHASGLRTTVEGKSAHEARPNRFVCSACIVG